MPSGHQLELVLDLLLEVAVGAAARHGADRAHAAIGFVGAPLIQIGLAWALVRAGQQRADHGAVGAGRDRLDDVAGILDAAVGDHRHVALTGLVRRIHDGRQLRHADAGHDARGADRARSDADLDGIGASIDQRLGALGRRHVAGHHLHPVRQPLDARHRLQHALGMAVRRVHHDQVAAGRDQPLGPLEAVLADAGRRSHPQPPCSSLQASGNFCAFSMSFTVMRPMQR